MTAELTPEDIALLEKSSKSPEEYIDLQRRAFLNTKTRRAFEKQVDALRHEYDAGQLDAAGLRSYGITLVLTGHFQEAIEVLESHLGDDIARFFSGRAHRELGRFRHAVATLAPLGHKSYLYVSEQIEALVAAGRIDDAAALQTGLAGTNAPPGLADYLLGLIADARGLYADAMKSYEKAIAAPGRAADVENRARFRLAFNHDLRGNDALARSGYELLRDVKPPHANALINLGVIYEDAGEYKRAVECYERVLEVYPNHERARLFLKDAMASMDEIVDEDRERRNDELTQKLRIPITDFELSVRSRNCLAKMEIKILGDLVQKTESELLSYKNFGETSLSEIKEILNSKGLRLGMTLDGPDAARILGERLPLIEPEEEPEASVEVLSKPIDFLELSVRSRKAMERLEIDSVGDLLELSEMMLISQKNFGQTSMNEVKSKLAVYGLKLRES